MDKADAKRFACRLVSWTLGSIETPEYLNENDRRRVQDSLSELDEELTRRAGDYSGLPLDIDHRVIELAINGTICLDVNEKSVTIFSLGSTFEDAERMAEILCPLESNEDYSLIFQMGGAHEQDNCTVSRFSRPTGSSGRPTVSSRGNRKDS